MTNLALPSAVVLKRPAAQPKSPTLKRSDSALVLGTSCKYNVMFYRRNHIEGIGKRSSKFFSSATRPMMSVSCATSLRREWHSWRRALPRQTSEHSCWSALSQAQRSNLTMTSCRVGMNDVLKNMTNTVCSSHSRAPAPRAPPAPPETATRNTLRPEPSFDTARSHIL